MSTAAILDNRYEGDNTLLQQICRAATLAAEGVWAFRACFRVLEAELRRRDVLRTMRLQAVAMLRHRNSEGFTFLHCALQCSGRSPHIIKLALQLLADAGVTLQDLEPFGSVVAASSVRTTAPALLWAPRLPAATLPQCRVMSLRVTFMTATQPLLLLRKEAAHTVRGVQSAPTLEWLHKVLPAREFTASDGGSDSDGGSGSGSGSGSDGGSSGNSGSDDDDDDDDDDSSASVGGWGQGDQRRERGCLLFGALWAQAQAQGATVETLAPFIASVNAVEDAPDEVVHDLVEASAASAAAVDLTADEVME